VHCCKASGWNARDLYGPRWQFCADNVEEKHHPTVIWKTRRIAGQDHPADRHDQKYRWGSGVARVAYTRNIGGSAKVCGFHIPKTAR